MIHDVTVSASLDDTKRNPSRLASVDAFYCIQHGELDESSFAPFYQDSRGGRAGYCARFTFLVNFNRKSYLKLLPEL